MAKTRTTKETLATKTVIETPPVTVSKKLHLTEILKKPIMAITSFLWDEKAGTFSTSRLQFILTSGFGAYLIWDVRNIIVSAYRANRDIPDLEWYIMAIVAYIGTGPLGYGLGKMGGRYRRRYPSIPEDDE